MKAAAMVTAGAGRLRWRDAPPVVLRPTGTDQVHLVHAAGGPLGGDDLGLAVTIVPGGALTVRSVAATVVQPGQPGTAGAPARWRVEVDAGAGARLRWLPEATVLTDGAALHSELTVRLAEGASVVLREQVILGRAGQRGGAYRGGLRVTVGGRPLLVHESLADGADPDLCGPAGTGGHRVLGTLLVAGAGVEPDRHAAGCRVGADLRWAVLPLDGPGYLVFALGDRATAVSAVLNELVCSAPPSAPCSEPPSVPSSMSSSMSWKSRPAM